MASRSLLTRLSRIPGFQLRSHPPRLIDLARNYASTATSSEPRTAIVTGSARGIGKSIALRLAQDGYDICVNDVGANRSEIEGTVAQVKSIGRKAIGVEADVTDYTQVKEMVQKSVSELGPLNTMVANAGITQVKRILEIEEQDFDLMYKVNVYGVQNSYKAAALQFIAQGNAVQNKPAKLIAAASIAGLRPFGLLAHYCASKAAVIGLTHSYGMELAEHSITCNCYSPGIVDTPMWDLIDEEIGRMRCASLGEVVKKGDVIKKYSRELISLGRTSVPEDVSKVVSFLAGRDSDYMTGQNIVVDGGIYFQ